MFQHIRVLVHRRPYLTAIVSGFLWNIFLIDMGLFALASSAILIGILIGLNRVVRWYDVFKKFPAALGCYLIVACLYVFTGKAIGRQLEWEPYVTGLITVHTIPFLLVGKWLGWVLGAVRRRQ